MCGSFFVPGDSRSGSLPPEQNETFPRASGLPVYVQMGKVHHEAFAASGRPRSVEARPPHIGVSQFGVPCRGNTL